MVDFTSSGMTHNSADYAAFKSPYRVAGAYARPNFGLVEIDWNAPGSPEIRLKIMGDGTVADGYSMELGELA